MSKIGCWGGGGGEAKKKGWKRRRKEKKREKKGRTKMNKDMEDVRKGRRKESMVKKMRKYGNDEEK